MEAEGIGSRIARSLAFKEGVINGRWDGVGFGVSSWNVRTRVAYFILG